MYYSQSSGGFYQDDESNLPNDAVMVPKDEYLLLLDNQCRGGVITSDEDGRLTSLFPSDPTISELRITKLAGINGAFETATSLLTAGYPPSEKDSWPDQKAEAMAWRANNATPTPYLDLLASYRGIDPLLYRQKTVSKVLVYTAAAAFLIGTRQKYADQIAAATSQAELDAIIPNFSIPGA